MKIKYLIIILIPLILSACSLSSEKAATTTAPPSAQSDPPTQPDQISPTTTPNPLDNKNIDNTELLNILDDLDKDLGLDTDFQDLDKQLN